MSPASPIAGAAGTYLPEQPIYTEPAEHTVRQRMPKRVQTGIKCPSCKSPKVRFSGSFTAFDGVLGVFGMKALRCHSCYNKFHRLFA